MGISPKFWGSQGWHFIHSVALNYPDNPTQEEKDNYLEFFKSVGNTLPCEICAEHFRKKMEDTPPNMNSREDLFNWTVDVHNAVNKENGKKTYTYKEAAKEIESNADNNKFKAILAGTSLSVSLILVITLFAYSIRKK
jgi:hypothetical protein